MQYDKPQMIIVMDLRNTIKNCLRRISVMKKIIVALLFASLICMKFHPYRVYAVTNESLESDYKLSRQPNGELYNDIIITLLLPHLQKAINNYYKDYLTYSPNVAPYTVHILDAQRPSSSVDFVIKLKVDSYVGSHLDVGVDYITVRVNPVVNVKIEKYEHINSYYNELPPNYQNIIKKRIRANY